MPVRQGGGLAATDRAAKRQRLLGVLDGADADELLLTSHGAIAWYLGGTRTHTSLAGDPLLAVVVGRDGDTVVLYSNERERLVAEELPDDVTVAEVPWYEPLALPAGPRVVRESEVAPQLRAGRGLLLDLHGGTVEGPHEQVRAQERHQPAQQHGPAEHGEGPVPPPAQARRAHRGEGLAW